jgi:formylglycine-generating enzyme required for sulfatase activity
MVNCDIITNSIGMQLVLLRAGEFMMGSPVAEDERDSDEGPVHSVHLSLDFYMSANLITQKQFTSILGWNYSRFMGPDNPVEMVSKTEAELFCQKLSELENKQYFLPTEAQWEYACRCGTSFAYEFGNNSEQLADYAWFKLNSGNHTHPVGGKKSNPWGLYDMHGNVWEWCLDKWQEAGYTLENNIDPVCNSGDTFVIRGGSYLNEPQALRCANRFGYNNQRSSCVGFRIVWRKG